MAVKSRYGRFSSWTVLTDNVIIKHCDLSVFEHHGSGLDAKVRWWWEVESLRYPGRVDFNLVFQGQAYDAHIEIDVNGRTRIFWSIKLKELFALQPHGEGNYPDLRFQKVGLNLYDVCFINAKTIEEDDQEALSSEVEIAPATASEGRQVRYYTTKYERDPNNRKLAIRLHGTKCCVCGFDFEKAYGPLGRNFIEIHHLKPLFSLNQEVEVNPATDLVPVCSNCHRMMHRHRGKVVSPEELKAMLQSS